METSTHTAKHEQMTEEVTVRSMQHADHVPGTGDDA